jgi:hypothetical protein
MRETRRFYLDQLKRLRSYRKMRIEHKDNPIYYLSAINDLISPILEAWQSHKQLPLKDAEVLRIEVIFLFGSLIYPNRMQ